MSVSALTRSGLAVAISVALASLLFVTIASGAPVTPEEPLAPGSISGAVSGPGGGRLAGIAVSLQRRNLDNTISFVDFTATDTNGEYRFSLLGPGRYLVQFFDPNRQYAPTYYSGAVDAAEATEIVIAGNQVSAIDVELAIAGGITGLLTTTTGNLIYSIVNLYEERLVSIYNGLPLRGWTIIQSRYLPPTSTVYSFGGLNVGPYRVCAEAYLADFGTLRECYDDQLLINDATDITVTLGLTTSGVDLLLGENANYTAITGVVRTAEGTPLPGIAVQAFYTTPYLGGWQQTSGVTDETGGYRLSNLYPTTYTVHFSDPTGEYAFQFADGVSRQDEARRLVMAPGQTISQVNATLTPAARISGTLTILGQPGAPGTYVRVLALVNGTYQWVTSASVVRGSGAYTVTGLPAGTYYLCANAWANAGSYYGCYGGLTETTATPVTVASGQTKTEVNFDLAGGPRYEGEIAGIVTAEGAPAAGIRVNLHYAGCCYSLDSYLIYTTTNGAGRYSFGGLTNGSYHVSFVDPAGLYASTIYSGKSTFLDVSSIFLTDTMKLTDINAVLVPGGSISGVVQTRAGEPVANLALRIYQYEGDAPSYSPTLFTTRTNADGTFTVRGVRPGSYAVCFADGSNLECYGQTSPYYYYYPISNKPNKVTVTAGEVTGGILHIWGPDFQQHLPLINLQ
jgi:5-hydroxyisourate hydrolase-like protein (transthyretin family)